MSQMSADNGIYILKTLRTRRNDDGRGWVKSDPYPVYRVAVVQAIDNFDWYEKNQFYNLGAYMKDTWGNSHPFESYDEAFAFAKRMAEGGSRYLEYGVSTIDTDYTFFGDM